MANNIKLCFFACLIFLVSCQDGFENIGDSPTEVFGELFEHIEENYVFLRYKNINFDSIKDLPNYGIDDMITDDELFTKCRELLKELKDGHCYIARSRATFSYDYTATYPIFFDPAIVEGNYLTEEFSSSSLRTHGLIDDIAYLHFDDFGRMFEVENEIDNLMMSNPSKFILDIRDNGGGPAENAQRMAEFFLTSDQVIGSITHKNGPGYDDFGPELPINATAKNKVSGIPVIILTNRASFSASSFFASMVRYQDNVTLMGQITGGGGGGETGYELPNGWSIGVTSNFFLDAQGNHIENGVEPDVEIINKEEDLQIGQDLMLQEAINF